MPGIWSGEMSAADIKVRVELRSHRGELLFGRPAQEIRQAVPMLDVKVTATPPQPWSAWRVRDGSAATSRTADWRAPVAYAKRSFAAGCPLGGG